MMHTRISALVVSLFLSSCAGSLHQPAAQRADARAQTDSITIALWHLDEAAGQILSDSGPLGLNGLAGTGTRAVPGVASAGLRFLGDPESYVVAPLHPGQQLLPASFTVEAWIRPSDLSTGSLQTIAAQWTAGKGKQNWILGVMSDTLLTDDAIGRGFRVATSHPYSLLFIYNSAGATADDPIRVRVSDKSVVPGIWSHIAVTYDAGRVRFFRDHKADLDGYHENELRAEERRMQPEPPWPSQSQLTIGNILKAPFTPGLRGVLVSPGLAFAGDIDEVRISTGARSDLVRSPRPKP
ncbi:MAG: LamG domain-containing protein [Candidatus Eisenbacteria bacterium]